VQLPFHAERARERIRDEDFVRFVVDDVARRREAEAEFYARADSL
jgi:hypothetical protein